MALVPMPGANAMAAGTAVAARLRGASAGLRRRLLEREPGRIASVDGAREFFRRLQATEGRGAGGGHTAAWVTVHELQRLDFRRFLGALAARF